MMWKKIVRNGLNHNRLLQRHKLQNRMFMTEGSAVCFAELDDLDQSLTQIYCYC